MTPPYSGLVASVVLFTLPRPPVDHQESNRTEEEKQRHGPSSRRPHRRVPPAGMPATPHTRHATSDTADRTGVAGESARRRVVASGTGGADLVPAPPHAFGRRRHGAAWRVS